MNDSNTCRICLKNDRTHKLGQISQMINIFSHKDVLKQIHDCTGVLLEINEMMPEKMCRKCFVLLRNAVDFRNKCRNSNEYLGSMKITLVDDITQTQNLKVDLIEQTTKEKEISFAQILLSTKEDTLSAFDAAEQYKNDTDKDDFGKDINEISINENLMLRNGKKNHLKAHEKRVLTKQRAQSKESSPGITNTNSVKRIKTVSKDILKNYMCEQCGNSFHTRHHFVTHLKRHAGDKQYECEICSNKFITHSELQRHMRKHTGERPFPCYHCERSFTDYSTRQKHERMHTNERPFPCTHCTKAFTSAYILKNHLLTHTGERAFKCSICNKSFLLQIHLVTHYRSFVHKQNEVKQRVKKEIV